MSTQYPPLPHRRLKLMANGIWDEVNKAFYPWKSTYSSVSAKQGILYYLHYVSIAHTVTGICAASSVSVRATINGVTSSLLALRIPNQTQAIDYFTGSIASLVDVLCDVNTGISMSGDTSSVIYAEIPSDLGWVVIE